MSSVVTSPPHDAAAPEGVLVEWLRCPGETAALALCIGSNLVIVAFGIAVVLAGSAWLDAHPLIEKRAAWLRAIVIAALVALPAAPIGRHIRAHAARTNGVRVGEDQFPELHARLLDVCRKLGIEDVPALYVSRTVEWPAVAYSVFGRRAVVVLKAELFAKDWVDRIDALAFVIAGALGSIRLGHTRWWVELLTDYARRVPGLRTPLLMKWTFSRDRCAAYAVPDGVRGLLLEAVGKDVAPDIDVAAFVRQAEKASGFWDLVAALQQKSPELTVRARALYAAGFLDWARDLEGRSSTPPPR